MKRSLIGRDALAAARAVASSVWSLTLVPLNLKPPFTSGWSRPMVLAVSLIARSSARRDSRSSFLPTAACCSEFMLETREVSCVSISARTALISAAARPPLLVAGKSAAFASANASARPRRSCRLLCVLFIVLPPFQSEGRAGCTFRLVLESYEALLCEFWREMQGFYTFRARLNLLIPHVCTLLSDLCAVISNQNVVTAN